jgi:hypothetical protein
MWDPNYALNVTNARNAIVADDLTLSPTTVLQLRYSLRATMKTREATLRKMDSTSLRWDFPRRWPRRKSTRFFLS